MNININQKREGVDVVSDTRGRMCADSVISTRYRSSLTCNATAAPVKRSFIMLRFIKAHFHTSSCCSTCYCRYCKMIDRVMFYSEKRFFLLFIYLIFFLESNRMTLVSRDVSSSSRSSLRYYNNKLEKKN